MLGARLCWELARRGWRQRSAYRAAVLAGLFTNSAFGALRGYILLAALAHRTQVAGLDKAAALGFAFYTQALLAPVHLWGWTDVVDRIRSGDIATDLYRPVDLQLWSWATAMGRAAYELVFRGVPMVVIGVVLFDVRLPAVARLPLVVATVALAISVGFLIAFLLNLLGFWLLDSNGLAAIANAFGFVLSGLAVLLTFLPSPWAGIALSTPYAAILQRPVEIVIGQHDTGEALLVLLFQALWVVVLWVGSQLLLRKAERRVVAQGG